MPKLKLYNTLTRQVEDFRPLKASQVTLYTCGPTVYDYTHIGHLRKYVGDDLLKRALQANDYQVKHVMNITDVGHLVSDEDAGEDKLEKGAREKGQTVWEVAKFFTDYFVKATLQVNIIPPDIIAKATDHIGEQVKLIEKLEKNGFTYQTQEAIYFDISKFPDYTKLSGQKLADKETGVRQEVIVDKNKKNPQDFALWFFTVDRFAGHVMHWPSPWGEGFPGWHIECSAMSMEYLGNTIDIHTGGIDHIAVHHTNEIAQSEAATGENFVRFWVHHGWLLIDGEKMSKSKKNFYTLDNIISKGFDPLALRYLFMTAHYRDMLNFTWDSLQASQNALDNLHQEVRTWDQPETATLNAASHVTLNIASPVTLNASEESQDPSAVPQDDEKYGQKFLSAINNDLNFPQALATMWEVVKSDLPSSQKAALLLQFDQVLGLDLKKYISNPIDIPAEVQKLINQREHARQSGDYQRSDDLRHEIKKLGFEIEDTPNGPRVKNKVP